MMNLLDLRMNKGVINLYRYREIAFAANERYLDALSVVENLAPAYRQVEKITETQLKSNCGHPLSSQGPFLTPAPPR